MKYLMLVCVDGSVDLSREDDPVEAGAPDPADVWVAETGKRRLDGDRLRPPAEATTVRVRGGRTVLSDGPFAETKEQIAGYDVLECADLDEAIEIASKHPVAAFGMLELRPFWTG
ncbi:MAG: YciI family protein [Mycobacteriales bacterium]